MSGNVAFIGLGRMGSAIASNVQKGGAHLTVWNRSRSKCEPLAAMGAHVAETAFDAVRDADVVLTSLMDDRSILDVLEGDGGILAGMRPGATHACLTTISPHFADRLSALHAQAGSRYVAAPVLGRPDAAASAQLVSYLAGDADGIEAVRPVAATYSKAIHVLPGPASTANSLKLCLNYTVVCLMELFGEAYTFAEASGVDPNAVGDFFETVFAHPGILYYARKILNRDFNSPAGFAMTAGLKDVTLMLEAAKAVGAKLEIGEIAYAKLQASIARGWTERDWSTMTEITRERASPRAQAG